MLEDNIENLTLEELIEKRDTLNERINAFEENIAEIIEYAVEFRQKREPEVRFFKNCIKHIFDGTFKTSDEYKIVILKERPDLSYENLSDLKDILSDEAISGEAILDINLEDDLPKVLFNGNFTNTSEKEIILKHLAIYHKETEFLCVYYNFSELSVRLDDHFTICSY